MVTMLKENWIIPSILAVVVVVALFAVYLPQGRKLDDLRGQIAAQKVAIEDEAVKASVVPQLSMQVEAMKKDLHNFDRRLPQRHELGNFLKTISACLGKQELKNQSIEPGNPTQDPEMQFHTLPIILRVQGPYPSLAGFLEEVDHMERTTRVQRLKINRPRVTAPLEIEVQMNIYFDNSVGREES